VVRWTFRPRRPASCNELGFEDGLGVITVGVASAIARKALEGTHPRIDIDGAAPQALDQCRRARPMKYQSRCLRNVSGMPGKEFKPHPLIHMAWVSLVLLRSAYPPPYSARVSQRRSHLQKVKFKHQPPTPHHLSLRSNVTPTRARRRRLPAPQIRTRSVVTQPSGLPTLPTTGFHLPRFFQSSAVRDRSSFLSTVRPLHPTQQIPATPPHLRADGAVRHVKDKHRERPRNRARRP
jgi:hypothetical protein